MSRLQLEGVSVGLGGVPIVTDVTVDCPAGQLVGLLGPNGSGKSTVLKAVYRALAPTQGAVLVDGEDVLADLTPREHARRVAAMSQEPGGGLDVSVLDLVASGRTPHQRTLSRESAHDRTLVADALETVGLTELAGRTVGALSGGERQRALLARALVQEPRVLVLDEPTNHLDIATQLGLLEVVRGLGVTVLTALHDLNLAATYCDAVHVLRDGVLVASGPPAQVLTPRLVADVFGVRADVTTHPATGRPHLAFSPLTEGPP